jgi:hypothetical protein
MVGAKVAVDPEGSLRASPLIDFVGRNEFDFTIKDVADGKPLSDIVGLSYRNASPPSRTVFRASSIPASKGSPH